MYTVRRLGSTNVEELQRLNHLFGEVFDDKEGYELHRPDTNYLLTFLSDSNHIVLVAEEGKEIVGGLVAYCLPKFEQNRKELFVYDLAVSESTQRQGIGKKLMELVRSVAKSMGAYVVFVQADEGDAAITFYEALEPSETSKTRNFDFTIL